MVIVTNAFDSYSAIGVREDLTDVIYNISPTETPFQSNAAKINVKSRTHEWQTDVLAGATANSSVEGDFLSATGITPTTRLKNYTQISRKVFAVTGTMEAIDKAGRQSEISYQIAKKGKELKRDMEQILTGSQASVVGNQSAARILAGVEAWVATNGTELGTGATSPGFVTATGLVTVVTDGGSLSSITEGHLKLAIAEAWTAGGDPTTIMVGPTTKQAISGFAGIATLFQNTNTAPGVIIGAADLYISDFGRHSVVPNRFSRDQTCLVLDMSMWAVGFLRPMHVIEIAKRGDAEERALLVEYTLESRNEAASAKVANVKP